LPALQLCYFVHLETKDTRAVPVCAQRDRGRVDCLAETVGALDKLIAHARSTATRIVYCRRAGTWSDADCPTRGVCGPALGWKEGGVDEEE